MLRRRRVLALAMLVLCFLPAPGAAILGVGDIVYDPANYANTLMTQINTLKSTINEGVMIANQAKALEYQVTSLLNEAKNLKANPLRLLGRIQGLWDAYNLILANAEGIAFTVDTAQAQFEQAYPAHATGSIQDITARSAEMLKNIRAASKTAVATQGVYTRLCDQLENSQQALTSAQVAEGALQIGQAQAQLQGIASEQLATIAEIEAAAARVNTEWIAKQAKEQADAIPINQNFMSDIAPQGFKPLGQR